MTVKETRLSPESACHVTSATFTSLTDASQPRRTEQMITTITKTSLFRFLTCHLQSAITFLRHQPPNVKFSGPPGPYHRMINARSARAGPLQRLLGTSRSANRAGSRWPGGLLSHQLLPASVPFWYRREYYHDGKKRQQNPRSRAYNEEYQSNARRPKCLCGRSTLSH